MRTKSKKASTRLLAINILNRVLIKNEYPDRAIDTEYGKAEDLNSKDAAFMTEIVYGTLRWLRYLDFMTLSLVRDRPKENVMNILRAGAYQICFMGGVSDYAAVTETVEAANILFGSGIAKFVNATLRNLIRKQQSIKPPEYEDDAIEHLGITKSYQNWMVQMWTDKYGTKYTARLLDALNQIPPMSIRVNSLKTDRKELISALEELGLSAKPSMFSPDGAELTKSGDPTDLDAFKAGRFTIQDEAAQLCTLLLEPRPGEKVLDACSAPGGKTTYVSELMKGQGHITATDISSRRLKMVEENTARLGIKNVRLLRADASKSEYLRGEEEGFDKVLVDAPCSGLGVIKRNPDAKWNKSRGDIKKASKLQMDILDNVAGLVKVGGVLVYSVCTLTDAENEQVCDWFIDKHKEFILERGLEPKSSFLKTFQSKEGFFIFDPVRHNTDGFFAARFRKAG